MARNDVKTFKAVSESGAEVTIEVFPDRVEVTLNDDGFLHGAILSESDSNSLLDFFDKVSAENS